MSDVLLDRELIAEIRRIEHATGRNDVLSGLVRTLEAKVGEFGAQFEGYVARADAKGAARAAHTLKGACHQLGAKALGELFAAIETSAKAENYEQAKRSFDEGAGLIRASLEALKRA
jgi:HPt (histidine-containing phosphotransfer) domain-containing protein